MERPWPDGVQGRPWLLRLFGVDRNPRQSRTVVRRYDDGRQYLRLHQRQPLFNKTVGIFDDEDRRVGYCQWSFKGGGLRDEFDLVRVDHQKFGEVRRTAAGVYRVAASKESQEGATVTISRSGVGPELSIACSVSLTEVAFDCDKDGTFLMAAAIMLFLSV